MKRNIMIVRLSHKVKTATYRKDIMKKTYYFKTLKWVAAQLACLTMIFSPLAMGKEAEALNKKNLQQMVNEFGLNKSTTVGEFWEKSKAFVPLYVYKDLEAFVKENKNLQMPEVTLDNAKGTDGADVPVMRFSLNGKTQSVQFYGEKNKWAKFNGVVLSALDLNRVSDAFMRIESSDIKLKTEADQYRKSKALKQQANEYQKDFDRFDGFPRITPQMWKSLNPEQRAGYLVKMRLMWMSARKVLATVSNAKPAKKSKDAASIQNFYNLIFAQKAEAKEGKQTPSAAVKVNGTSVKTKAGVVNIPYDAKSCVVAGYIGAYGKVNNVSGDNRDGCSIDIAVATYKSNMELKFVQEANDTCSALKSTQVACNPIIYGFPDGKPACIDRKSAEYQHATHFTSPTNKETCDGKSRLSSTDDIIKFNDKDYVGIQPREKQIAAIEVDQQKDDYALTQSYLKGVLAKNDPLMIALLEKGEWNLKLDEELVRIQSQFEQEIERAIKTCENDITGKHEANQKLACDQLHRRWLFTERTIANLRDKACVKPALYVGNYNVGESSYADSATKKTAQNKKTIDEKGTDLCECPAKPEVKRVAFRESCEATPVQAAVVLPAPLTEAIPAPEVAKKCDKPEGIAGFDYDKCKCEENKKLKLQSGDDGGYECEGTNWLPWALGGLGILALIAFFNRSKNPSTPPVVIPPPPSCTPPKLGISPNCSCPAAPSLCTPPQKIYNTSTCQCTNVPQPPVCADATVAPAGNLTLCPKCPNGSFKTPAGCPTEGGAGNNTCAHPPCSGGLPRTGN